MLGLLCNEWIKGYYNESVLKDTLVDITHEIGKFPTDEIYLIDLANERYRAIKFTGETVSDSRKHIDVIFLTTKMGKRIAEIKISPMEERITIKYEFDNYDMVLYDPSTGKNICLLEFDYSGKWLNYNMQVDRADEKIEILRIK